MKQNICFFPVSGVSPVNLHIVKTRVESFKPFFVHLHPFGLLAWLTAFGLALFFRKNDK